MKTICNTYKSILDKLRDLSLLLIRLILAYGFYLPAKLKLKDVHAIGDWFASMNYPLPYVNAYLATATETLGIILLVLGLGIRIISIPLIIVLLVAIFTVHLSHGFEASNNGFEIPLYYILMLFILLTHGAGKYSVDQIIKRKNS
ncbi:MAG TPA: DoxX family protein [Sunxiuqinia sp.]|nr:DoxX family protein [Sunxiuqinia sp.]